MGSLERLHQMFDRLASKIGPYLPFTNSYHLRKMMGGDGKTVLDVGCGNGGTMAVLNHHHRFAGIVGVDIYRPYLEICRRDGTHDYLVQADVRCLPFKPRSFDIVVCLEVLEHLEKKDGISFLKGLENIARARVVLSLPIGNWVQHAYDGNPYQQHRSQWEPSEMRELGYKVHVTGVRNTGGDWRGRKGFWRILDILWRLFSVAVAPIVFFFPQAASNMVCGKRINMT